MAPRAQEPVRVVREEIHLRALELQAHGQEGAAKSIEAATASLTVGVRALSDAAVAHNSIDAQKDQRILALLGEVAERNGRIAALERATEDFKDRQLAREAELKKLQIEAEARSKMLGQMLAMALPVLGPAAKFGLLMLAAKFGLQVPGMDSILSALPTGLPPGVPPVPPYQGPPTVDTAFTPSGPPMAPVPVTSAFAGQWLAALVALLQCASLETGGELRALLFDAFTGSASDPRVQRVLDRLSKEAGEQRLTDLLTFTFAARNPAGPS